MAYVINRWDGTAISTIEDGTVDTTLDIKLIGKNFAGYGELQNENFLHMLENFARDTAPTNAIRGQLWYDTTTKKIKFYTGDQIAGVKVWKTAGGVEYGIEPSNPTVGDLWFDTERNQLKVRASATSWLAIGPQSAGTGVTQMVSRSLKDTDENQQAVIAATVEDEIVAIISPNNFTIDTDDIDSNIAGFNTETSKVIKKGITLPYSNADGISQLDPPHLFWGTSSNSLRLGGFLASDYVRSGSSNFTSVVRFSDLGYTVGDDNDLAVFIESGTAPIIDNTTGQTITFRVRDGSTIKTPMILNISSVDPGVDEQYTLGTPTKQWSNVYSTTFTGIATQADSLAVGGNYRVASTSAGANTIAARDASGNLTAGVFSGVATSARYADLAEKYLPDHPYESGTVVSIGGTAEITAAKFGDRALGVVSTDPAYMMNSDLEGGIYVALKGRVPVRVQGPVKKGDRLIANNHGCAKAAEFVSQYPNVFGFALEDCDSEEITLVECAII